MLRGSSNDVYAFYQLATSKHREAPERFASLPRPLAIISIFLTESILYCVIVTANNAFLF